jgi:hypothetical protein
MLPVRCYPLKNASADTSGKFSIFEHGAFEGNV